MVLTKLDSALRRRSPAGWYAFRTVAGLLLALGLFAWIGLWFQRGFWLGVTQAVICVLVLAHEFGILPGSRRD